MYQPNAPCRPPSANTPASFQPSRAPMRPRHQNQRSGTRNTIPIARPSRRWQYSNQKMLLNSASDMPLLTSRYSGVCRYFSNTVCQSASESGGTVPTSGCHSTIESPEWVSRVTPPTTTIAATASAHTRSHVATVRSAAGSAGAAAPASEASAAIDLVTARFCRKSAARP